MCVCGWVGVCACVCEACVCLHPITCDTCMTDTSRSIIRETTLLFIYSTPRAYAKLLCTRRVRHIFTSHNVYKHICVCSGNDEHEQGRCDSTDLSEQIIYSSHFLFLFPGKKLTVLTRNKKKKNEKMIKYAKY